MKLTNIKPSLTQTRNPLYFQLGVRGAPEPRRNGLLRPREG